MLLNEQTAFPSEIKSVVVYFKIAVILPSFEKFINLRLWKNLHFYGLCTALRPHHHSNYVSSRISFVFGCGFSVESFFLLLQKMTDAGNHPEITVYRFSQA